MRFVLAIAMTVSLASVAFARDLTVATWNLGWHMNQAEAKAWINDCGQPFALNPTSGLW